MRRSSRNAALWWRCARSIGRERFLRCGFWWRGSLRQSSSLRPNRSSSLRKSSARQSLIEISSRGGIRLPDGRVLHAYPPASHLRELLVGLVVEVFGDVFG